MTWDEKAISSERKMVVDMLDKLQGPTDRKHGRGRGNL
jgi:hypothetical protein